MKRYIAVVGSSSCPPDIAKLAYEVGQEIALAQAILVCGGLGGVMEEACRGAQEKKGITLGILPGHQRRGNPYLTLALPTGLGEARNFLVVKVADAVIAVGGEYGTLSEIAMALKLGKPVIGLKTWELFREGKADQGIIKAKNAKDAVNLALGRSGSEE